jgi:hypothetical protein
VISSLVEFHITNTAAPRGVPDGVCVQVNGFGEPVFPVVPVCDSEPASHPTAISGLACARG